jgi:hypothetical protein
MLAAAAAVLIPAYLRGLVGAVLAVLAVVEGAAVQ